jgi:hypothetical protein
MTQFTPDKLKARNTAFSPPKTGTKIASQLYWLAWPALRAILPWLTVSEGYTPHEL